VVEGGEAVARILVIDDSRFSRNMVIRGLREAGHEVIEAPDGAAGLEAVREHRPDCVVLDMLMPVLDGPGFLERLRSDGSSLPVIVATADIQAATRSLCEGLGISGFINKPVRAEELRVCIERALGVGQEARP
jgi:two-component system chemotaxis response regulator CheY